ncbi:MAG TPA: NUDIX domain-containing protein [Symbiobacteriaceae bacterium]|jgi:8-oxo-dGTP pyrophosphatase MutT (NUDIX family)|nr:NUDIX domain-containing protein [Symbiobacteriaceae bacterium]
MALKERFKIIPAVHLFLVRGDEVLLLRRFNTGYEDGNYSVPAGHLDGGEEVKSAAIREAAEEIGVTIDPADLAVAGVMHRLSDSERVDFFVATARWSGMVANMEPDKCDELRWCHLDALPANTVPYVRRALQNYREQRWFDSFGWGGQ